MSEIKISTHWNLFERVFSAKRMRPYIDACGGNSEKAVALFEYNSRVGAELWLLISHIEISLRNALNEQMIDLAKKRNYQYSWLTDEENILGSKNENPSHTLFNEIEKAKKRIQKKQKALTDSQLVADLSLSFWSRLVSKSYTNIWPDLASAFPNMNSREQTLAFEVINDLTLMRNRIAHHERVWNFDLEYYVASFIQLAAYLDWGLYDYLADIADNILQIIETSRFVP